MRIALIFPPYTHKIFSENLSVIDEEFCLGPPIILAYVAAILEKAGHEVILIDARVLNLTKEEALLRLKNFDPDILGFRAETYHFYDALEWVSYMKKELDIPVIAGGPNLSMYPKETLSHKEIDYGIIGEAIDSLPKLIKSLEYGEEINDIAGVAYRKNGDIVINPPSQNYIDFDSYPFPARYLLPNDRYYSFVSQRKNFTIMLTSTGCPFHCSFCAIHVHNRYRQRSPKNIVDEIELCYREFGIREIDFFDAVMFLNKPRVLEMFNEIRRRNLKIDWSCRSRVDVVDKEILKEAARAGCRQIYYGIESSEESILRAINKEVSIEQIKLAIRWSKEFGIMTLGFFMIGNPGESKANIWHSLDFAKNLNLDFLQVCRTIAKPGTDLDKIMIEKTNKDYWREHILGKQIRERLPSPWHSLNEIELEKISRKFYLKFYFRPYVILNRILQLKSISEFFRYIKVAIKLLLQRQEL